MKTADIVIGEAYRTTRDVRVIVLDKGWVDTDRGRPTNDPSRRYRKRPGAPDLAVARKSWGSDSAPWIPDVLRPQQIHCAEAVWQERWEAQQRIAAAERERRQAAHDRDAALIAEARKVSGLGDRARITRLAGGFNLDEATLRALVQRAARAEPVETRP